MSNNGHIKSCRLSFPVALCLVAIAAAPIVMAVGKLQGQSRTSKQSTRTTRGSVTRRSPKYPPSARTKISGIFMGWGKGRYGKKACIAIKFIPKGRATKASINAPCITPNFKTYYLDPPVLSRAKRLKLGEGVEIDYVSYNGWVWLIDLHGVGEPRRPSESKSGSRSVGTSQIPIDRFVFVGAKKVRTSGGVNVTVVARRGSNMWKFEVPFEPGETGELSRSKLPLGKKNGDKTPDPPKSDKPETLSQKVATFVAGDIVALKYETDTDSPNFQFILTGISPYRMSAIGTLTGTSKRVIRGKKHDQAYLRTGKTKLALTVPLVSRHDVETDAVKLASALKSLGAAEAVFTYYKSRGVMWLESVTAK